MATRDIELGEVAVDAAPTRSPDGKQSNSARLSRRSSATPERDIHGRRLSAAPAQSPAADLAKRPSAVERRPSAAPAHFAPASDLHRSATFEVRSLSPPSLRTATSRSAPQPLNTSPAAGGKGAAEPSAAPKTMTDKLVAALVVAGIIVFTVFQIRESVLAHENPSTKSSVELVSRTFPGLMICPFSRNQRGFPGACPKWRSDALLQYEGFRSDEQRSISYFFNSNLHIESKRSPVACPKNRIKGDYLHFLHFMNKNNSYFDHRIITDFYQKVIVKNSAGSTLKCEPKFDSGVVLECKNPRDAVTFPYLCPSWTPPNVECTVFDPHHFDRQAKLYGMDPMCNPMKEVVANTVDSLDFTLPDTFLEDLVLEGRILSGYKYSGLIPQPDAPTAQFFPENQFKRQPEELFAGLFSLNRQKGRSTNLNFSLFAGVVAVLYDSSKGIPKTLNFDNVYSNSMSNDILTSAVILRTNCDYVSSNAINDVCPQEKPQGIDVSVTPQIEVEFSNKITGQYVNRTVYTTAKHPSTKKLRGCFLEHSINGYSELCNPDISIFFTSATTVINTQIINLSILTTVSIVLSTAGTLWGSQEKIKAGIALVKEKLCAKKQEVDVTNMRQA